MKTALAMVCMLLLAWTQPVFERVAAASEVRPGRACCGCGSNCCTANNHKPESPPVSAMPVSSSSNPLLLLAPPALSWILPDPAAFAFSVSSFPRLNPVGVPLFARNCAWLI